jgi:hypothetical protein
MKMAAALILVSHAISGQEPARPRTVVMLPAAIRDSMSLIWSRNNRHWDEVPETNGRTQMLPANWHTELRYLGCLAGHLTGDTLWVTQLVPAANLTQHQMSVTGDCSNVPELIGTWRTHPFRAGFRGRAIKERGLSGRELKRFTASAELVVIVMWDADSIDLATRGPDGARHPAPYVLRQ